MLSRCGYAMLRVMEAVVAVPVNLDNGATRYFLTSGLIQAAVDPEPWDSSYGRGDRVLTWRFARRGQGVPDAS